MSYYWTIIFIYVITLHKMNICRMNVKYIHNILKLTNVIGYNDSKEVATLQRQDIKIHKVV